MQRDEGINTSKWLEQRKAFFIVLTFALVFLLIIFSCGFQYLVGSRIAPVDFCTKGDEVYQAYVDNVDQWMGYFREYEDEIALRTATSTGQKVVVLAQSWQDRPDSPVLFNIMGAPGNPNYSYFGGWGYMYDPSRRLSGLAFDDYTFQFVDSDIYCYFKNDTIFLHQLDS